MWIGTVRLGLERGEVPVGDPKAQRRDSGPGVSDEQGGIPHLQREQVRRVLRLREVCSFRRFHPC